MTKQSIQCIDLSSCFPLNSPFKIFYMSYIAFEVNPICKDALMLTLDPIILF